VCEVLSLDGVADHPDRFFGEGDDEAHAATADWIATQDTVILGHRSYDEWVGFWPSSDTEPFASFINTVTKHVAASGPLDIEWANARAIDGELVDFVRDLKARPGGEIGVHGSISVVQALLTAGVVDEVRLVVAPTVVGLGRRLFDGVPSVRLDLIGCAISPTGYLILDYRVMG
jgi:dihydrofolate reductase